MRIDNEKLIELVRINPVLYDITNEKYNFNRVKNVVWQNIAMQLGCSENLCKRAWSCLRDSYRRSLRRKKELRTQYPQTEFKKWKYEDKLQFIAPFTTTDGDFSVDYPKINDAGEIKKECLPTNYSPYSGDPNSNPETSQPKFEAPDDEDSPPPPIPEITMICDETQSVSTGVKTKPRARKRKIKNDRESVSKTFLNFIQDVKDVVLRESDEIDQFFVSMAAIVKTLSPINQHIAKTRIFTAVSELEMQEIISRYPIPVPQAETPSEPTDSNLTALNSIVEKITEDVSHGDST